MTDRTNTVLTSRAVLINPGQGIAISVHRLDVTQIEVRWERGDVGAPQQQAIVVSLHPYQCAKVLFRGEQANRRIIGQKLSEFLRQLSPEVACTVYMHILTATIDQRKCPGG
ncbi:hypothetical protein D3C80_1799900 [compost metagenome]